MTPARSARPDPLRIGILGCANIARQFARDVAPSRAVRIQAVASRQADKAAEFAATFHLPRAHASYEALLADPDVQAIYLPLPNSLHAHWAVKAAQAGKHVLCEKPLSLGLKEAQTMFAAAQAHGVMLLEAYPYWFQPQTAALVKVLNDGVLGTVRMVQASFGFPLSRPLGNIRMAADLGGGALLDAGSYPASFIRLVMGSAPQEVWARSQWADTGVDIAMQAQLHWADGRSAHLSCAMNTANHRHATVVGTQGTVETEYLNHTHAAGARTPHPYGYQPSLMRLRRGTANTVPFEVVPSASGSGFRFAAEAFARAVAQQDHAAIARAAQASQDIAAMLEALAASARSGKPVRL